MLSKNHPIILFIDRNGFGIYQDVLVNIPRFNFTPDLVANLDVINKDQFANLIATFIQINKMVPSSLAVVLSDDVIYIKDLANSVQKPALVQGLKTDLNDDKEHKEEVQNFLEDVPFEEVLAKVIKVGQASRIVAVNKDLVMAIIDAFVNKGSVMEAVVPGFMYGQSVNFTAGLTSDNIKVILENVEVLKSSNLLTGQEKMIAPQGLESELKNLPVNEAKKSKNSRQYILVGVFVVLLIILGIVYFASQTPPQSPKVKSASVVVNETSVPPTIPPVSQPVVIQESPTAASLDSKLINIKISHSVSSSQTAVSLKTIFSNLGVENVTEEILESSIPEKSSVIFSQNIPADLRNTIIVEIKKILPGISVLESQDPNFTVNILLGKS